VSEEISKMQKHVLVLMTSAVVLACGVIAASAQQAPASRVSGQLNRERGLILSEGFDGRRMSRAMVPSSRLLR
jgi:hypothetical protein